MLHQIKAMFVKDLSKNTILSKIKDYHLLKNLIFASIIDIDSTDE